jgi:DNA-binding NarL/FixJ family response regulator
MADKILIVDDDPYAIQGIAAALEEKFEVFGALTVADMYALLKKHAFALTILDLDLKAEGNGLDLIDIIKGYCKKVMVLTTCHNQANLLACLRAQVCGFVHKRTSIDNLLIKVSGALAGYNMTEPSLLATLTDEENQLPRFGWRELQLIDLIYAYPAASTLDYATKLNLAEGSVKNMLSRIFSKMHVNRKIQFLEALKVRGYRPTDVKNLAE